MAKNNENNQSQFIDFFSLIFFAEMPENRISQLNKHVALAGK